MERLKGHFRACFLLRRSLPFGGSEEDEDEGGQAPRDGDPLSREQSESLK